METVDAFITILTNEVCSGNWRDDDQQKKQFVPWKQVGLWLKWTPHMMSISQRLLEF